MKISDITSFNTIQCIDKSIHFKITSKNTDKAYLTNVSLSLFNTVKHDLVKCKEIAITNINNGSYRLSF